MRSLFKGARGPIWPHLILIPASIIAIYPVLWVVKMALSSSQRLDTSPSPFPREVSFDNFIAVATHADKAGHWLFGRQLFNSLVTALRKIRTIAQTSPRSMHAPQCKRERDALTGMTADLNKEGGKA